eukprot:gene29803-35984_t
MHANTLLHGSSSIGNNAFAPIGLPPPSPAIRAGLSVQDLKKMTAMRMANNGEGSSNAYTPPVHRHVADIASSYQTASPQQLQAAGILPVVINDRGASRARRGGQRGGMGPRSFAQGQGGQQQGRYPPSAFTQYSPAPTPAPLPMASYRSPPSPYGPEVRSPPYSSQFLSAEEQGESYSARPQSLFPPAQAPSRIAPLARGASSGLFVEDERGNGQTARLAPLPLPSPTFPLLKSKTSPNKLSLLDASSSPSPSLRPLLRKTLSQRGGEGAWLAGQMAESVLDAPSPPLSSPLTLRQQPRLGWEEETWGRDY